MAKLSSEARAVWAWAVACALSLLMAVLSGYGAATPAEPTGAQNDSPGIFPVF